MEGVRGIYSLLCIYIYIYTIATFAFLLIGKQLVVANER